MRFLLAGLGSIGHRHLRNLLALGERDIVLYRTGKSTLADAELDGFPSSDDLHAALSDWQPDAVVVANPTALHLSVAIPAAQAGCHLLIEKPLTDNAEELEELRAAVSEGGTRVLVGFQFRFNPGLSRAKELLEEGVVGQPLSAHVHWGEHLPDWHPWEDYRISYAARADLGGGVILTLCHPFDYLRWILGEVVSVQAEARRTGALELEVEDSADLLLTLASGVQASVHLDYNQRPPRHDLELIGSKGTLRWDGLSGEVRWWSVDTGRWLSHPAPKGFERNSMFFDEMQHFVRVAKGEADPVCTLTDGERATQIAVAALDAAASGQRVALDPSLARRPSSGEEFRKADRRERSTDAG